MTDRTKALGRWGEACAAGYLSQLGWTVLETNARTPYGELDLVAFTTELQLPVIVFVEVKTRASTTLGPPEISITGRKQAHLLKASQAYLQAHPDLPQYCRIDVIAISGSPHSGEPEIFHFENALTTV
jgi:putative endonuclease